MSILRKIAGLFKRDRTSDLIRFRTIFEEFQRILNGNNRSLELMSRLDDVFSGEYIFDINFIRQLTRELSENIHQITTSLNNMTERRYEELIECHATIQDDLDHIISGGIVPSKHKLILTSDEMDIDCAPLIGSKNARLGEIRSNLGMAIPECIAVSTLMYEQIMENNHLWDRIGELCENMAGRDRFPADKYDAAIDNLFNNAVIPPPLENQFTRALNQLVRKAGPKAGYAVRSSAWGEDEQGLSFAGQFETVLNAPRAEVLGAYLKVIASRFKSVAMEYGGPLMLDRTRLPVAVGIQRMIPARASGVMYSMGPGRDERDSLLIAANYGLGTSVVVGDVDSDMFRVSRLRPDAVLEKRIGKKETMIVPVHEGGINRVPCPDGWRRWSCLSDEGVLQLTEKGLILERYYRRPVDVEWAFGEDGELYTLQCRPLHLPQQIKPSAVDLSDLRKTWPTAMEEHGQVAQRGIAAGTVRHLKDEDDPLQFPVGAVAVARFTTPRLAAVVRRAVAIITDIGSSTGHMATVAREFGVPMIVNTEVATQVLKDGDEITVDAEENVVYRGIIRELLEYEVESEDVFRDLSEYRIVHQLIRKISTLSMIDPNSPDFTAKNCKTYHDIIRFCHEKAVQELINLNISSRKFRGIKSKKLDTPIPLDLAVIDLGGGLQISPDEEGMASVNDVTSKPMLALLEGTLEPGAWSTQPVKLGVGDLISSLTRFTLNDQSGELLGQNLAVVSENYANVSLRLGYHFNVIDAYVSEDIDDNYVYFRFVGGVTETQRRHLRAVLLQKILEALDFKVTVDGDLVIARLKKWESSRLLATLRDLGRLIGFSRQLDTQMRDAGSVDEYLRIFLDSKRS